MKQHFYDRKRTGAAVRDRSQGQVIVDVVGCGEERRRSTFDGKPCLSLTLSSLHTKEGGCLSSLKELGLPGSTRDPPQVLPRVAIY